MNSKSYGILTGLTVLFCTSLVVSNIIAGKLWQLPFGIVLTSGSMLFPIVYIVGDVIPEVFGLKVARKVILTGFLANLFAVVFFTLCLKLAYPPYWQNQSAFETVLGFTPRLLAASFVGYLIGTNANALVLVVVKRLTNSKFLWMRTISSTIVGEFLDSLFFMAIGFFGVVPQSVLVGMVLSQSLFKIGYEVVATPLTYIVVGYAKRFAQ